jgi:hypothetical protein
MAHALGIMYAGKWWKQLYAMGHVWMVCRLAVMPKKSASATIPANPLMPALKAPIRPSEAIHA